MSGTLIRLPGSPKDHSWLTSLDDAFQGYDDHGKRPKIILMSSVFWESYLDYLGTPHRGEDVALVSFRAVQVLEDVDCPGIWLGDDPRSNLIPLPSSAIPEIEVSMAKAESDLAMENLKAEIDKLATTLDGNPVTKWIARKLWDLAGRPC